MSSNSQKMLTDYYKSSKMSKKRSKLYDLFIYLIIVWLINCFIKFVISFFNEFILYRSHFILSEYIMYMLFTNLWYILFIK